VPSAGNVSGPHLLRALVTRVFAAAARRLSSGEENMKASWRWFTIASLLVISAGTQVHGQAGNYPNRAVKIILDSAAGSTPDVALRFVADRLGQSWGQQVLVVNQPGAGGSIAARAAADSAPDGYTLYQPVLSTFVALPGPAPNIPLEVPRDFAPIGFVAQNPMFVAVVPSLGVGTLPELIALAKKRPGEIPYAVTGVGRLTHLTGELLQIRAAIKLLLVPYTGGPAHALNDIMGGRVSLIIEGYSGIAGAIRAGQLRPIAVGSAQRLPDFPDLPTVAETLPGFAATGWQVLVAPVGTPEAVIRKVSEDLRQVVGEADFQKKIATLGSYARPMSPAEVTAFIAGEQRMWKPVLEQIAVRQQ
jgi:tripartite-type tricarboxylate transporter receptor subunit TctC